jgi:hypothetical protein
MGLMPDFDPCDGNPSSLKNARWLRAVEPLPALKRRAGQSRLYESYRLIGDFL